MVRIISSRSSITCHEHQLVRGLLSLLLNNWWHIAPAKPLTSLFYKPEVQTLAVIPYRHRSGAGEKVLLKFLLLTALTTTLKSYLSTSLPVSKFPNSILNKIHINREQSISCALSPQRYRFYNEDAWVAGGFELCE